MKRAQKSNPAKLAQQHEDRLRQALTDLFNDCCPLSSSGWQRLIAVDPQLAADARREAFLKSFDQILLSAMEKPLYAGDPTLLPVEETFEMLLDAVVWHLINKIGSERTVEIFDEFGTTIPLC